MVNVPDSIIKDNHIYKIAHYDLEDSMGYYEIHPLGTFSIYDTNGCQILSQSYFNDKVMYTHMINYNDCSPQTIRISNSVNINDEEAVISEYCVPKRDKESQRTEVEEGVLLLYEINESAEGFPPLKVGKLYSYYNEDVLDSMLYYDMHDVLHDRMCYKYFENGLMRSSENSTFYGGITNHYSMFQFNSKGLPIHAHIVTNTFYEQRNKKYGYIIERFEDGGIKD